MGRGGARCTWICGKHGLVLHFGAWRAGRGSSLVTPWKDCLLFCGLKKCSFSKIQPLPRRLWFFGFPSPYIPRNCYSCSRRTQLCLWVPLLWSHSGGSVGGQMQSLPERLLREAVHPACTEWGRWNVLWCWILAGQIFFLSRPELYQWNLRRKWGCWRGIC